MGPDGTARGRASAPYGPSYMKVPGSVRLVRRRTRACPPSALQRAPGRVGSSRRSAVPHPGQKPWTVSRRRPQAGHALPAAGAAFAGIATPIRAATTPAIARPVAPAASSSARAHAPSALGAPPTSRAGPRAAQEGEDANAVEAPRPAATSRTTPAATIQGLTGAQETRGSWSFATQSKEPSLEPLRPCFACFEPAEETLRTSADREEHAPGQRRTRPRGRSAHDGAHPDPGPQAPGARPTTASARAGEVAPGLPRLDVEEPACRRAPRERPSRPPRPRRKSHGSPSRRKAPLRHPPSAARQRGPARPGGERGDAGPRQRTSAEIPDRPTCRTEAGTVLTDGQPPEAPVAGEGGDFRSPRKGSVRTRDAEPSGV